MTLTTADLDSIRAIVIEGFEALAVPRFDALDDRMDRLEGRVDGLEGRIDKLEYEMHISFDSLSRQIDGLEGSTKALENDVKELYRLMPAR